MRSGLFRIVYADSGEPVEVGGHYAFGIETVEAEIRARPARFVLMPGPDLFAPEGLTVQRVTGGREGDDVAALPLATETLLRLELLRVQELARQATEIWRAGQRMHDAAEFDAAMGELAQAVPLKPRPPIVSGPDDLF